MKKTITINTEYDISKEGRYTIYPVSYGNIDGIKQFGLVGSESQEDLRSEFRICLNTDQFLNLFRLMGDMVGSLKEQETSKDDTSE